MRYSFSGNVDYCIEFEKYYIKTDSGYTNDIELTKEEFVYFYDGLLNSMTFLKVKNSYYRYDKIVEFGPISNTLL